MVPIGSRLLNNGGWNVCYMNSAFQGLLATFPSGDFKRRANDKDQEFIHVLEQIRADPESRGEGAILDLRPVLTHFDLQKEFPISVQHDAFQFITSLLGKLSSRVRSLFTIEQAKTRICLKCADNHQHQVSDLGLAVNLGPKTKSVQSLVKLAFSDELVRDYKCVCGGQTAVVLRTEVVREPSILMVAIQRSQTAKEKDRRPIKMSLKCKLDVDGRPVKYTLAAAIIHLGDTPKQGHYIITSRNTNDVWILYDDDKRQIIKTDEIQKLYGKDIYILLYVKAN